MRPNSLKQRFPILPYLLTAAVMICTACASDAPSRRKLSPDGEAQPVPVYDIPAPLPESPFLLQDGHQTAPERVSWSRKPGASPADLSALTIAAADKEAIRIWRGDGVLLGILPWDSNETELRGEMHTPFVLLSGEGRLAHLSRDRKQLLVSLFPSPRYGGSPGFGDGAWKEGGREGNSREENLQGGNPLEKETGPLPLFSSDREISSLVSSPSIGEGQERGATLLLGFADGGGLLLDDRSGAMLAQFSLPGGRQTMVDGAFSPDGRRLLLATSTGELFLYPHGADTSHEADGSHDIGSTIDRCKIIGDLTGISKIAFLSSKLILTRTAEGRLSLWELTDNHYQSPALRFIREIEAAGVHSFYLDPGWGTGPSVDKTEFPEEEIAKARIALIMEPKRGQDTPILKLYTIDPAMPETSLRLYRSDSRPASIAFFPIPAGPLYLSRISPAGGNLMIYDDLRGLILHRFPGAMNRIIDSLILPSGYEMAQQGTILLLYRDRIELRDRGGNLTSRFQLPDTPSPITSLLPDGADGLFLLTTAGDLLHTILPELYNPGINPHISSTLSLNSLGKSSIASPETLIFDTPDLFDKPSLPDNPSLPDKPGRRLLLISSKGLEILSLSPNLSILQSRRLPFPENISLQAIHTISLEDGTLRLLAQVVSPGLSSSSQEIPPEKLLLLDLPIPLPKQIPAGMLMKSSEELSGKTPVGVTKKQLFSIPHQVREIQLLPGGTKALIQVDFRRRPLTNEQVLPGYLLLDLEHGDIHPLAATDPGAKLLAADTDTFLELLPDEKRLRIRPIASPDDTPGDTPAAGNASLDLDAPPPRPLQWIETASGRDGWISWSDRGIFSGSANAGRLLGLVNAAPSLFSSLSPSPGTLFLAEQFLYTSNAPDLLLESSGAAPSSSDTIQWYRSHRLRRTAALKEKLPDRSPASSRPEPLRPIPLLDAPLPPELRILSAKTTRITDMKSEMNLVFSITPGSPRAPLQASSKPGTPAPAVPTTPATPLYYQIKVNGVPLFPFPGRALPATAERTAPTAPASRTSSSTAPSSAPSGTSDPTIISHPITLYEEFNRVEVTTLDSAGLISHPVFTWGEVKKAKAGEAWFAGVGVSDYDKDDKNDSVSDYDLSTGPAPQRDNANSLKLPFAAKDARDLRIYFDNVVFHRSFALEHKLFTNREVTPRTISQIKEYFSQTTEDDIAVLFIAARSTFTPETGWHLLLPGLHPLSYQQILSVFDTTPARRRLILLDPAPLEETLSTVPRRSTTTSRATTTREATELYRSRAILTDPLSDPGASIIISRLPGQESLANPELRNRLFAESLLVTLTDRSSDADLSGFIDLDELFIPIASQVAQGSHRRQTPAILQRNRRTPIFLPAVTDFGVDIPSLLRQSDQGRYTAPDTPVPEKSSPGLNSNPLSW